MTFEERKALVKSYLGKTVRIEIDRSMGYVHKKENYSLTYPINYGYIPNVISGDGEELDVYLLGVDTPVTEYTGKERQGTVLCLDWIYFKHLSTNPFV